jgi:hypothetical protein
MANQDLNNSRFTKEAAEWDSNTKHVESTQKAFEAIQRYVPAFGDGGNKGNVTTMINLLIKNLLVLIVASPRRP